jgi:hypothetical protein
MIEVASCPANLATWDPSTQPYYLEIFGETSPAVDTRYAEVVPKHADKEPEASAGPVYEYWWTIGHPGLGEEMSHWWEILGKKPEHESVWKNLADPAARVYLYFPLQGGWRIKELVATVKYLRPAPHLETIEQKAAEDWKKVAPVVGGIGSVASFVPNPAFTGAATALSAISKVQVNTVPQTDDFNWSVGKVTFGTPAHGVKQGVIWRLSKNLFAELGGRITGSLAVSFIPSQVQAGQTVNAGPTSFEPQAILAHAVVYGPNGPIWVPDKHEFVQLQIAPTVQGEGNQPET